MDEMGKDVKELLQWMLEVADARNSNPRAKTVNMKFTRRTLAMWQERAREALAEAAERENAAIADAQHGFDNMALGYYVPSR